MSASQAAIDHTEVATGLSYEALVDAQELTTRQLLAYCQLPWNDACMHFEHNPTAVSTVSASQVRQPLYR